jgi:precorrin-6Y C5,15-methyltransferase (decarboxylating)
LKQFSPETCWLSIVGIGEDGWDGLSPAARRAIATATLIYGGARHLAHLPSEASTASRVPWSSPMSASLATILTQHRGQQKITVLASGDPMLYGVGVTLTRQLKAGEFQVIPQVSSFALACARLGWPGSETTLISLVSRPIEQVLRYLAPGQHLVLYSEDGTTPATIAKLLTQAGFGQSELHLFENLGGPSERHRIERASAWPAQRCGDLNLIAVACVADAGIQTLSTVPGLPDDAFETDGQLTKREIRAATLARLAPLPGQLLWDVGAGTGTIGVEWMRTHPSCSCTAFEEKESRSANIRLNADRLGVPTLKIVQGRVPDTFAHQHQAPDAIFVGGGISGSGLFEACWSRLIPGGRLVANAVTIESEALLAGWHRLHGGELVRMQIARAEPVGSTCAWRQMMPVTQWAVVKS